MVDLLAQYQRIQPQVDEAIMEVVRSSAYINGPAVKNFQTELENYLEVKYVIPCANGTDALQIALMALGLKPGDEVIVPTFTYVATAEVIALLGLTPVLVDVYPDTFNIDVEEIEKAITEKTKAIVPVHLFGQCADMEAILKIAKKHKLKVVEDAAQAIGADFIFKKRQASGDARQQKAGTIGDIGCTSFFPSKNLGCYGDGGAMMTNNKTLAEKLRKIANHGQGERYYHDIVGVNSRLDSMQAAILRQKLPWLDEYNAARRRAADWYDAAFAENPNLTPPHRAKNSSHVFHQYTLKLDARIDRNAMQKFLMEKEIPAMIYYPVALHEQKAYKSNRYKKGDFPVTESLTERVISLPMHTELTENQLNHITETVLQFVNQ